MSNQMRIEELVPVLQERGRTGRSITAVAGPPGSGKSTLADMLADRLNASDPGSAAVMGMDGYHFDDLVLVPRGWRPRKGAPHTYDVAGFLQMLNRLHANKDISGIAIPVFDRSLEIARAGARIIPQTVRHLIIEGNYLLLNEAPWSKLANQFDTTVFLDVPMQVITERLEERWAGLAEEERRQKLEENDLPNARLVCGQSCEAEFTVSWQECEN